jgi:hypothetical protein
MDSLNPKTWIIFYLLSFATLLWAVFLCTQETMLGISLLLDTVIIGVNCAIVLGEVRRHTERKDRMRILLTGSDSDKEKNRRWWGRR